MTATTATKRFVNLGRARTTLPGPAGHPVIVHPFEESLNRRTYRADAVYVLEGDFWGRYATGVHSQLNRFPRPSQYGRESFPTLAALLEDGTRVDLASATLDASGGAQHVQASPGKRRLTGDVITPEGMIRRTLPDGTVTLVDDTPENRHLLHSEVAGVETTRNPEIRGGIETWLKEMHVSSYQEFSDLPDEVLLKIPGVSAANLPAIRENVGRVLREAEGLERPDETPVAATSTTAMARVTDDPLGGALDADDAPPKKVTKKKAAKKATKKVTKKKAKRKAKKKAKKKSTRRKASD